METQTNLPLSSYQALAEFRYQIRRFMRFSEQMARSEGIEPQQHQLLLTVKGLPSDKKATISELAERLQIQHHSTVELIDRLAENGYVERQRDTEDHRRVLIQLTERGEEILQQLSSIVLAELRQTGPSLVQSLGKLIEQENKSRER